MFYDDELASERNFDTDEEEAPLESEGEAMSGLEEEEEDPYQEN